jgi:hypothetical protein
MQTRPTAGIFAKLRAMLHGDKPTAGAQPPEQVVTEPTAGAQPPEPVVTEPTEPRPAPTPAAAAQPPAKEA